MHLCIPINASAWVHVVMDTTKDGTDEQERLTRRPSASKTILFPFGQMIWSTWKMIYNFVFIFKSILPFLFFIFNVCSNLFYSLFTWVRTFSQVKSCVFKDITSTSVLEWPILQTIQPFFILSMCSRVTTDLLPVAVTTISTCFTTWDNFTTWRWIEKL